MRMLKVIFIIAIVIAILAIAIFLFFRLNPSFGYKFTKDREERVEQSPNFNDGKFHNLVKTSVQIEGFKFTDVLGDFMFGGKKRKPSEPIQTKRFDKEEFASQDTGITITWFGHSTALIQMDGFTILADPVFSERTSPVSFAGTRAFNYTNVYNLNDLPELDAIIISHDHYDHLDYKTIKELREKQVMFFVPLGIAAHLEKWGVASKHIVEMDWWEEYVLKDKLKFVATPSRHFSGRRGMDNKTLWCSWVIKSDYHAFYFSGDSGYEDHFKKIGDKYGPFDISMLECGQYNENWPYIHMMPEETVQANIDLKSDAMIPIHWGRFDLSLHHWTEPVERAGAEASSKRVKIVIPEIGKVIHINKLQENVYWWKRE